MSLCKVGGFYFVLDGHHRVSVATITASSGWTPM